MKKPKPRKAPKPRNVAAKSLGTATFRPRVEQDPRAYKRKPKHRRIVTIPPDEEPGETG